MQTKIYGLKSGNQYFTHTTKSGDTGLELPCTSIYVNNARLMNEEELELYKKKFPYFQVAIINQINK